MTSETRINLSAEEIGERFDLLATDAKEYALFLIGLGGQIICWNPGAERLLGYPSSEIIGQHFSRFFTPEDVVTGEPEHELKTALAEGHRNKEEFMALLSHELRSPLSPIRNALDILRQMKTNDPIIAQAGGIIDRQVGVMVRLVDDLLDIGRITKGKLRLTKEHVELRKVANDASEAVRPFMDARKHDFSVSLPTVPIWVEADPARIEQVVVNLLNNAAKYTEAGGLIRMAVSQEGDEAVIRVRDNGVGIAPELLPHIFELFTQVDGSLGRSYGGLGIGLALARNLVEMHDGRLQASSSGLGKGCEFTIKLPMLP